MDLGIKRCERMIRAERAFLPNLFGAVKEAEVAVPSYQSESVCVVFFFTSCSVIKKGEGSSRYRTKRNDVDNQHPMLQRYQLEVHHLDPGPHHVILGKTLNIRLVKLVLNAATFEVGHGGEEETHVHGGEDELVGCDAGEDGAVCGLELDALEDLVPCRGCRTKDGCFCSLTGLLRRLGRSRGNHREM